MRNEDFRAESPRSRLWARAGIGAGFEGIGKEITVRQRPCSPPHRPRKPPAEP
jgi:hypothetical protein